MDTTDTLDTAKYAHIVGVFRDRAKADQAVEALKQAGMSDVDLTVYDPQAAGVVDTPVDAGEASAMDTSVATSVVETATRLATAARFLVHVLAEGREQDAVGILANCGANNADIPPGTMLVHGTIVSADEDSAHRVAEKLTENTPAESFFGTAKAPGHPHAISSMDRPNAPHG
jgi:hypothetical protein